MPKITAWNGRLPLDDDLIRKRILFSYHVIYLSGKGIGKIQTTAALLFFSYPAFFLRRIISVTPDPPTKTPTLSNILPTRKYFFDRYFV